MGWGKISGYQHSAQALRVDFERHAWEVSLYGSDIIRLHDQGSDARLGGGQSRAVTAEAYAVRQSPLAVQMRGTKLMITAEAFTLRIGTDGVTEWLDHSGRVRTRLEPAPAQGPYGASPLRFSLSLGTGDVIYGLGDKAGSLNKRGYEYENWNTDDPTPHIDSTKKLYKSIPFFSLLRADDGAALGCFFDNTFHSYFDLGKTRENVLFCAADGGAFDLYFLAGPTLPELLRQFTALTGRMPLPQRWTLGYHHSRWGIRSGAECLRLARSLREYDLPCDVLHADIDYMEAYKVFTFDAERFPEPRLLTRRLADRGIHLVCIQDPGVKVEAGYSIYEEGQTRGYFLRDSADRIYENTVWPGAAAFPDFGRREVRAWWASLQKFYLDAGVRGIWDDMNEPTGFEGEFPADLPSHDEEKIATHAQMHNLYGHLMAQATFEGLQALDGRRPFVITRACYAGTQRFACTWTGDNRSLWAHLAMAIPQLLNLGLSGMAFAGSDVGGFADDVSAELLIRWAWLGALSPLFRNHSHLDARSQEPWTFGAETLACYRQALRLRYRLLPYLYDQFLTCTRSGAPLLRPLAWNWPGDQEVREINDSFLLGENILAAPVVTQGARRRLVYLPSGDWRDFWDDTFYRGGRWLIAAAPLDRVPLFVPDGAVLPWGQDVPSSAMEDSRLLQLRLWPGRPAAEHTYEHYQDQGETFAYRAGAYNLLWVAWDGREHLSLRFERRAYPEGYRRLRILWKGCRFEFPLDQDILELTLPREPKAKEVEG